MNELIKVNINENQEPVISGRELHKALEVTERYSSWFDRMTQYGFTENYVKVKTPWNPELVNTLHEINLTKIDDDGSVRMEFIAALV